MNPIRKTLKREAPFPLVLGFAMAVVQPVVASSSQLAALCFEENTIGALGGQGGGTGWIGNWTPAGNVTRAEVVDTSGNPLVHVVPGGTTIGGASRALEVQLSGAAASQPAGVRTLAAPVSQTFYVGYLARYVGSGTWAGANNTFTLHLGTSASDTGGVNFGLRGGTTNEFMVRSGTGAPVSGASTGGELMNNQTYHLVCRMNWNGTAFTSADMWLDPGMNDHVETPNGDATLGGFAVASPISHLFFRQAVLDANDILQADEIRIGTHWTDVVPQAVSAQMVTTYPLETPGALRNPLMGFRPYLSNWSGNPYTTVVHHYIRWNQIENHADHTVQKIRDFCDSQWANLPASNVKVIPRVFLDWDANPGNEYWPADLASGDWTSEQFKDRVVRLIGRLGEVWDHDPRVAWVQTGIIGWWGEQENPVGVDQDGWAQRMGDAFTNAFRNKQLVVRNMNHWPGYEMGGHWDSFGHPGQTNGAWNSIRNYNNQGRYQTQVIEGEVAYDWGESWFDPLYGGEPTITLGNTQFTDNMIDVIRELHASALGWISSYRTDGSFGTNPEVVRANAARMQAEFGYRFHITEFAASARTEPGALLEVRFKVKNKGSAPFYENWPLAVALIDEGTRLEVWRATLPDVDIRTWQPGHNYDSGTRTYLTPALEHEVTAALPVPANLPPGQYLLGLGILEPNSRTPGVFFAVPNFFKESQSQPLIRIGIGANAGSHEVAGMGFDDLFADDSRYYTITRDVPSHTLTLETSALGTITASPGGTTHAKDTGVRLTAHPIPGYEFSSWGGALAGWDRNPAIVVMDADRTVSANYVAVPAYHILHINASDGSVTLDPPGGVYHPGTVVTLTAAPDSGYRFANWSGDLDGNENPTVITMDDNKCITANFSTFGGFGNLRINGEGGTLRLEWTGVGTLQTTTILDGPWTDLPGSSSPYMFPITDPARFFRLRKETTESPEP